MTDRTSKWQQWLEKIWYQNGNGRFLLLPLSALYCAINRYQRISYSRNLPAIPCPVIVVGNITVGGTGKTPLTIYLTKLLQKAGYKPAIITRGYGGTTSFTQSVTADTDPKLVGDEAVLMATRAQVPVYAGADRLASVNKIIQEQDCDVIISDDGMQHYKLPRDIQIAVIDGERQLGNGYCLPAGPLREKKERLSECDFVVQNGAELANASWQKLKLKGEILVNLKTGKERALSDFSGEKVNAVTGIGNPQRFFKTLEQGGLVVQPHSFPDHHPFQETDFNFDNDLAILMTEKDAVKCQSFATDNFWFLPITARLNDEFEAELLALLTQIKAKKRAKL